MNIGVSSGVSWTNKLLDCRLLARGGQVRVATRHGNGLVSHQVFDCQQVGAFHRQSAGKGVAQAMPREIA